MRWTWPSWVAIALGAIAIGAAFFYWQPGQSLLVQSMAPWMLLVGGMLLAAGLHALQGAWSSCCGDCGDYGCDCGHCEGCKGGDCCGQCECYGKPGESPGHEGHGHDGGHSH